MHTDHTHRCDSTRTALAVTVGLTLGLIAVATALMMTGSITGDDAPLLLAVFSASLTALIPVWTGKGTCKKKRRPEGLGPVDDV